MNFDKNWKKLIQHGKRLREEKNKREKFIEEHNGLTPEEILEIQKRAEEEEEKIIIASESNEERIADLILEQRVINEEQNELISGLVKRLLENQQEAQNKVLELVEKSKETHEILQKSIEKDDAETTQITTKMLELIELKKRKLAES